MIKIGAEILGGYSLLPKDIFMIPYMNTDGTVNWNKLNEICQQIADTGASFLREFPYWPTSGGDWNIYLQPFWYYRDKSTIWDKQYFENWTKIFKFMFEQYNLTPVFVLFNASETRVKEYGAKGNSPWKPFDDYFYTMDSEKVRHRWIDEILNCAKEAKVNIWLEICNEPPPKACNMMIDTFEYLVIKKKFPMNRIINGWDIHRKEKEPDYAFAYRKWRDTCAKIIIDSKKFEIFGNTDKDKMEYACELLKKETWTTMHACAEKTVSEYFGPNPSDLTLRNQVFSTDGSKNSEGKRITFQDGYKLTKVVFDRKRKAIKVGKIFLSFLIAKEVCEMPDLKIKVKDHYRSLKGSCAYIADVERQKLQNRGKFPEPLPLPEWLGIKDIQEPEELEQPEEPGNEKEEKKMTFLKFIKKWWRWGLAVILIGFLIYLGFKSPWWHLLGYPLIIGCYKIKLFKL